VSDASAVVLGALAALHGIWAFSTWPLDSRARFAEVVAGVDERDLPAPTAVLGMAGLLALAAPGGRVPPACATRCERALTARCGSCGR
jgi:hypothetical protein